MKLKHIIANRLLPKRFRRFCRFAYLRVWNTIRHLDPHYIAFISIEVSTACNRHCTYCPQDKHPLKQEFINRRVFRTILARIADIKWSGPMDFIHYNEPLLHPEILGLVEETRMALPKAFLILSTNADRLTEEFAACLIDAGINQFNITHHIPRNDEWDQRIARLQKQWPNHIRVLESPGEDKWSNRAGLVEIPGLTELRGKCTGPEFLTITTRGDILLCCNDYHKQHVMGNVLERSILEIYYDPEVAETRKRIRRGRSLIPLCYNCK